MPLNIVERGAGDPVLFLPGFTEGADDFEPVVAFLAQRYRVVAVDLPGSGRSTPLPRAYTPDLYEDDARVMARQLEDRAIRSATLVGFSDGGEIALLLAIRRPDLARAVVAWGAAGVVPGSIAPILDAWAELVDHPPERLVGWRRSLIDRYGEDVVRATFRSWTSAVRSLMERGGNISLAEAGQIACPVLLIAGENDMFVPATALGELGSHIPSATVAIVPGVGHSVHAKVPAWFERTVLDWLAVNASS